MIPIRTTVPTRYPPFVSQLLQLNPIAAKPEHRIIRYELSDYEWTAIKPMLPNKPRGVRRVNDRHQIILGCSTAANVQPAFAAADELSPADRNGVVAAGGNGGER
jgi:hypothetical protein